MKLPPDCARPGCPSSRRTHDRPHVNSFPPVSTRRRGFIGVTILVLGVSAAVGLTSIDAASRRQAAPPTTVTLLTRDTRRPLSTTVIDGQEMVALDDLAGPFQLSVTEDTLAGGVTVSFKTRSILLTPGQSLASVGGRLVSLAAPLTKSGKRWFVPIEFINRGLALVYDQPLDLRKASRLVILGNLRVPRTSVRYETAPSMTRVVIETTPRTASTIVQENGRLLVKFDAEALDALFPQLPPSSLAESVRVVDPGNVIEVDLAPRFQSFRAMSPPPDSGTGRVTIDLLAGDADTAPAPAPSPAPAPAPAGPAESPLSMDATSASVRTIVIDPGHGGDDNGDRGRGGALEKQVTLAVSRRLKTILETRLGIRVLMTRETDRTVGLDERAALANNNKADIFLSLHTNASFSPALKGTEVYYLNLDRYADEARRAAASDRQLLPVFGGGERDIEIVQWDLAQSRHVEQSAILAQALEVDLRTKVAMAPHPLQRAPLRVLVGANMPAVLVELGYLTNGEQERQLTSEGFQVTLAQALFEGVVHYRDVADRPVAGPGPPAQAPEVRTASQR